MSDWIPSKKELATSLLTSIITSILTAILVFLVTTLVLSTPTSPTTEHEISIVSAYPSGENEYTLVIEDTGDFDEEDIVVSITNHDGYDRSSRIPSLSPGQDVALTFSLPEPRVRSFKRHNSTRYVLKNESLARDVCNQKSPGGLQPSNPVISITEEHLSGEFTIPQSYTVIVEYPDHRDPTHRMSFSFPHEYIVSEDAEHRVVPVNVKTEEGICYFNGFPLFWLLENGGEYVDYAPKSNTFN